MDKLAIYPFLGEQKIPYEKIEHPAVFNMEQLASIHLPHPEWDAKNLFVRDDKKRNYYLITVKGDKRVDLKEFSQAACSARAQFCLCGGFACRSGADSRRRLPARHSERHRARVHVYLDREFAGSKIGVHPNDNTATVWLQADDLLALLKQHGNEAVYTDL